ncbi:MAG: type II toxin-antitoxin system VapC family toxin [Planctomycetota bacterium]|nr:type II toxin-antitoxin system VapC family toxin [Planctomycetota bacterium]
MHLDTNAYTAFKLGMADAVFIIKHADEIVVSVVVLGELRAGFEVGTRASQNNRELLEFLASPRVRVALVTPDITEQYAAIYAQLRHDGRPIPTNDMWIAAVTGVDSGAALYTHDPHFEYVRGLHVVSSAAAFRKLSG